MILSSSDTFIGLRNSFIHRYLDDAASTDAISEKVAPPSPGTMVQTTPLENDEGHSPLEAQRLADETLSLALQSVMNCALLPCSIGRRTTNGTTNCWKFNRHIRRITSRDKLPSR
jgi:hypothetical protein